MNTNDALEKFQKLGFNSIAYFQNLTLALRKYH
jgi:hypothetical protein